MVTGSYKKIPRHLCECGCGQEVEKNRSRFIRGHHLKYIRRKKEEQKIGDYNGNLEANNAH